MQKRNNLILIVIFIPIILLSQQYHQKNILAITYSPAIVLTPDNQFGIQPGVKF